MSGSSSTSSTVALAPSPSPLAGIAKNATPRVVDRSTMCTNRAFPAAAGPERHALLDEIGLRQRERPVPEGGDEQVGVSVPGEGPDLVRASPSGHGPEDVERRTLDRRGG